MNYEIYCYFSKKGEADLIEALEVLDCEAHFRPGNIMEKKKQLARRILEVNSDLRVLNYNYKEIANFHGITDDEAEARFDFIQIQSFQKAHDLSIVIFDNLISLTIPFNLLENVSEEILSNVISYLRVITDETGYFVYDSESEKVYSARNVSDFTFNLLRLKSKTQGQNNYQKKTWWKFWGKGH